MRNDLQRIKKQQSLIAYYELNKARLINKTNKYQTRTHRIIQAPGDISFNEFTRHIN